MKRLLLLVVASSGLFAQYSGPKTVYILPMAGGLDQYVAQWLTKEHLMQVVTDPKAAEVFMTDSLGQAFEQRLKQLVPPETSSKTGGDDSQHIFRTSRTKGTIFIVDAKTHHVLWSDHQKPPSSNSDRSLNRTAEEIAKKLAGPKTSGS
jgi:hypothetical protein